MEGDSGKPEAKEDVTSNNSQIPQLYPVSTSSSQTPTLWLRAPNFQVLLEGLGVQEVNRIVGRSSQDNYRVQNVV